MVGYDVIGIVRKVRGVYSQTNNIYVARFRFISATVASNYWRQYIMYLALWITDRNRYLEHCARFSFKMILLMLFVLLLLILPIREERRARGAAVGSARREEVETKSRRIRMRNRCSFFLSLYIPFERTVLTALTVAGDR